MCSILGIFNLSVSSAELRSQALMLSRKQRHRGPDWSGVYMSAHALMVHERLAIVDVDHGAQPLYSSHVNGSNTNNVTNNVLAVNGEIYNFRQLKAQLTSPYTFTTTSDCEVILALYQQEGVRLLNKLQGMYAFALYDESRDRYFIARDPMGIVPLYIGSDAVGQVYVASEMKAIACVCDKVEIFPPGHYLLSRDDEGHACNEKVRYYTRSWMEPVSFFSKQKGVFNRSFESSVTMIRESLISAVKSHLMTDVPYGVLLSGGLDSSIVAAIVKQFSGRRIEDDEQTLAWWPSLHTFAIGLKGSPDLQAAQQVADHIGSIHHTIVYNEQEGIDALSEVIYHLETYDVTTVRASVPMYLMARKIRAMGIKMVLSGEGSDELFGGYLYFHKAPSPQALHEETIRKLSRLHVYDCLRANKSMMAWSVEARVPFLDQAFVDRAMQLDPAFKMSNENRIEKYLLRRAFEDMLPASVVWRQKEQFSDGVGYQWIDSLQTYADQCVSNDQMVHVKKRFPYNTPLTKEAYLYRSLFEQHFPQAFAAKTVPGGKSVACSTSEALQWDPSLQACIDPSGRAVSTVHHAGYDQCK